MPFTKPVKTVLVRDAKAISLINKHAKKEDRSANHLVTRTIIETLGDSKPASKDNDAG